ncbi:hypothetical protein CDAR_410531 [Caerostris darwini]|uniref:Uncharacterized protein n=1 Tax=Caerostris darwini TaxID=1538125 RepID=A0AAV4SQJ1_9ARAC|nr:hypothetical protein CDAR_410531 [Caerostris darwini]
MIGFLKRHALLIIKIKDETASADKSAAKELLQKLAKIIEVGGCTPDEHSQAVESGRFMKEMYFTTGRKMKSFTFFAFLFLEDNGNLGVYSRQTFRNRIKLQKLQEK